MERMIFGHPHVSPAFILAVPFYWIGGVWGVLVFQVLCFGIAAIGVFLYAWVRLRDGWAATLTHLHFWGMWGITSALASDFHEVVIGIMGLPFVWLGLELRRYWLAFVGWAIFIGGKENLALWGVWMALGLCFFYKDAERRKRLLGMALAAALWFLAGHLFYSSKASENIVIGPSRTETLYGYLAVSDPLAAINGRSPESHFSYARILRTFFTKPQLLWSLLFESPYDTGQYRFIKSELYWVLLWSGGWSFFFAPLYFVLLLPVFVYKFLSMDPATWGIFHQYSVEFVCILPLAVLHAAGKWKKRSLFWVALAGGAIGAHLVNFFVMRGPYSIWYMPDNVLWYSCAHYRSDFLYPCVHEGLAIVPREAPVMVSHRLSPHVPPRPDYYVWPAGGAQVDYILFLKSEYAPWPTLAREVAKDIRALERSRGWEKIWDKCDLVIFRRRPQR